MTHKVNTKYGVLRVHEDEQGAVRISFYTNDDVAIEIKSNNSIIFHAIEPRTNKIRTKKNLKEIDKLLNAGGESQDE